MPVYNKYPQPKIRKIVAIAFMAVLLVPVMALAHQPRITDGRVTISTY